MGKEVLFIFRFIRDGIKSIYASFSHSPDVQLDGRIDQRLRSETTLLLIPSVTIKLFLNWFKRPIH